MAVSSDIQRPVVSTRPTLVYEENWEEHLTTLGPAPSHWLFTGGMLLASPPHIISGHPPNGNLLDPAVAKPLGQSSPTSTAEAMVRGISPDRNPLTSRDAGASVESLETCPSLRSSSSRESLASWTSFDELDPDPFHASPVDERAPREPFILTRDREVAAPPVDPEKFAQAALSRRHFALHQHQQLAKRFSLESLPRTSSPQSIPREISPVEIAREKLPIIMRPRHPLLSSSNPSSCKSEGHSALFSGVTTTTPSIVPRVHVVSQSTNLATSLAARSLNSYLVSVGDSGTSGAVRSLRRVMRQDSDVADSVHAASTTSIARRSKRSRSSMHSEWVMV